MLVLFFVIFYLQDLQHPCIVRFFGLSAKQIVEDQTYRLMMVMEAGDSEFGEHIYSKTTKIGFEESLQMLIEVARGMRYLHLVSVLSRLFLTDRGDLV
jgi:hypothetical protein